MKVFAGRRALGLATGTALVAMGALEIWLHQSDYTNPAVQRFCNAGFCPDQFSPVRVFEISQKATLGDPQGGLRDFQQALRLNPDSAYRWADLGDAEVNVRDYKAADYAYSRALELGPRSAVILMRTANGYFAMGELQLVLPRLQAVLRDPMLRDYYDAAFLTLSRLGLSMDDILTEGVPPRREAVSALLNFLAKFNRQDEAIKTWRWAAQRQLADPESTGRFFSMLMKDGKEDVAQDLWSQYAGGKEVGYRINNYIYNPSFESTPSRSPFDWTIDPWPNVDAELVEGVAFQGRRSFRIRFQGLSNVQYHGTYQKMVLPPGHYDFTAMVKSESITTDEGLRIHIFDWPTEAKLNSWSEMVLGTKDWEKLEQKLEVPAGVKVVLVEFVRNGSKMFDNKVRGTIWVDDLRLVRR